VVELQTIEVLETQVVDEVLDDEVVELLGFHLRLLIIQQHELYKLMVEIEETDEIEHT